MWCVSSALVWSMLSYLLLSSEWFVPKQVEYSVEKERQSFRASQADESTNLDCGTGEKDEIDRLKIVWKSSRYVLEIKEWKIVACLGIQLRCITIGATWAEITAITSRLKALIKHTSCTRSYHANA